MDKEERYNYVFEQYDGDSFIYDLKEDKRIDDLSQCAYILNKYEAKLAESENLNKRLQQVIDKLRDKEFAGETLVNAINAVYEPVYQNKCDEVEQLKKQLAEKNELLIATKWKVDDLEKQLAESEKESNARYNAWQEEIGECDRLRVALAEKEEYIKYNVPKLIEANEKMSKQLQEEKNRSKKLNHEAQKYYEDAYCNGSQNQTAIAELEKVKEYWLKHEDIGYYIDQQIKSLKGEK